MEYQEGPLTYIVLTAQTMVTVEILPYQGQISMLGPGIESGTS
jgi:hypothetical protein